MQSLQRRPSIFLDDAFEDSTLDSSGGSFSCQHTEDTGETKNLTVVFKDYSKNTVLAFRYPDGSDFALIVAMR